MIQDYTTEELRAELERREGPEEKVPEMLSEFNLEELIAHCQEYINGLDPKSNEWLADPEETIYQCAIETLYGDDIWEWIHSKTEENGRNK